MSPERGCACCSGIGVPLNRRLLLGGGAAAALLPLRPALAKGKYGYYDAMVLSCIDPRMQKPVAGYLQDRDLAGRYSMFTIAGAAIGVVAPAFAKWHPAFWDNLATSIELHHIKTVIAIDHRDCGAAKIAYGDNKVANPKIETETHRTAIAEFKKEVAERHPDLKVEGGLMAVNGRIEMFT